MHRLSSLAIFLALAGSIITVVVVRSWANDPQPPTKPKPAANSDDSDPFGNADPGPPTRPTAAAPAITKPAEVRNGDPFGAGPAIPVQPPLAAPPAAPNATPTPASAPPAQPSTPSSPPSLLAGVVCVQQRPTSLVRILTPEMAAAHEPQTIIDADASAESPAVMKIRAALEAPAEFAFKETPLKDAVAHLKNRYRIEIQLDSAGLKDAGVDESAPITKSVKGVSLFAALRLVLDEFQLKYVIHNEVLVITSPQKAESDEFMATRIYPVKDLILVRNENDEIETDFQSLIDLITNTVSQKCWLDNGGSGTIAPYQLRDRCNLVIMQTQEVHEQLDAFFSALRRCDNGGGKAGNELRLPKRPKAVTPTYYVVPGTAPQRNDLLMGGGFGS
jgi:hypothetical protein